MASQNERETETMYVKNGPSKFDLMASLFDSTGRHKRMVEFTLDHGKNPIRIAIEGVQQEDGSGESWNFQGTFHGRGDPGTRLYLRVRGYFTTRWRTGTLRFAARTLREPDATEQLASLMKELQEGGHV